MIYASRYGPPYPIPVTFFFSFRLYVERMFVRLRLLTISFTLLLFLYTLITNFRFPFFVLFYLFSLSLPVAQQEHQENY